jgi:hypothetical protein
MMLQEVTKENFLLYLLHFYRDEKLCKKNTFDRVAFLSIVLKKAYEHKEYFERQYPGFYETRCNPFKYHNEEQLTPIQFIEKELQAEESIQEVRIPPDNYSPSSPH